MARGCRMLRGFASVVGVTVLAVLLGAAPVAATQAPSLTSSVSGSTFHPTTASRILDSRVASQVGPFSSPWATGTTRAVTVAGTDVPADATAVVLNVTVTDTTAPSFLTVWPAGRPRPTASSLNWTPGSVVANAITVAPGDADQVDVYNLAGSADVIIDLSGYYEAGPGSGFTPVEPVRLLDSRAAWQVGPFSSPWATGTTRAVTVAGTDVPADATAVVLNVTVTDTTAPSFLTVWPAGQPRPTASSLNWTPNHAVANAITVAPGDADQVDVYNLAGSADVIIDLSGYYEAGTGGHFHPVAPSRVLDSRPGTQVGPYATPWSGGTNRYVTIAGAASVPTDATAVTANLTVADTTAASFLKIWSAGPNIGTISTLNWTPGEVVANAATIAPGSAGQIQIYNLAGSVDVIMDVNGYFA